MRQASANVCARNGQELENWLKLTWVYREKQRKWWCNLSLFDLKLVALLKHRRMHTKDGLRHCLLAHALHWSGYRVHFAILTHIAGSTQFRCDLVTLISDMDTFKLDYKNMRLHHNTMMLEKLHWGLQRESSVPLPAKPMLAASWSSNCFQGVELWAVHFLIAQNTPVWRTLYFLWMYLQGWD